MMQESILLAGAADKGLTMLQTLLPPGVYTSEKLCHSGNEVRRCMAENEFHMVLINTPLLDENGLDLSVEIAQQSTAGVILFVKAELAEAVAARVESSGVLVIAKPVLRPLFDQALHFCNAARSRMQALQSEKARLERKLDEQRVIGRAKCMLVQYLQMTEDQAHRYIEKQAMDNRQTRSAIARAIIDEYSM